MAWILLVLAGILEVIWAYFMKQSAGFTKLIPSILTITIMIASFVLLSISMKSMPLGTAYAVWTGIGAVGAFIVGAIFLGESLNVIRVLAACFIVVGLVMMKISSNS